MKFRHTMTIAARRRARPLYKLSTGAAVAALAVTAAACGGSTQSSTTSTQGAAHKGGTFTILANSAFGVADPAQNYTLEEWQLLIDTHDGLVGFAKVGGVPGTKIVPDLATSIPMPTNGGKTYVFHIRQRDQVLQRPDAQAQRLRHDVRAAVHRARPDLLLLRHRRREQVQHEGLRPLQGRGRQRLGLHADAQPDRAGPGADGPALAAVRLRGTGRHVAEADRQQRAAGHRAVHVEVVQPEHPGRAGPQPVLPRVERRGAAGRATRTRSSRSTGCRSPTR